MLFSFYKGRMQEGLEVPGRGRNGASDSESRAYSWVPGCISVTDRDHSFLIQHICHVLGSW